MNSTVTNPAALAAFVSFVGACAHVPPPQTRRIELTCQYPVIAPLAETTEVQTKGGIEIAVAASPIACRAHSETQTLPRAPNESEQFEDGIRGFTTPRTETTTTPTLEPEPERVAFTLRINNQLPRVFRGRGAVVHFAVDGSAWAGKEDDYAAFTDLMILPRGQAAIEIMGPPVQTLKGSSGGVMGISLFDVVTAMDAAGNVSEKQNFEWLYRYSLNTETKVGTVSIVRH